MSTSSFFSLEYNSIFGFVILGVGLFLIIAAFISLLNKIQRTESKNVLAPANRSNFLLILTGVLLVTSSVVFLFVNRPIPSVPENASITSEAWNALNQSDYQSAINKTKQCIKTYEGDAIKEQERLASSNTPLFPVGKTSPEVTTLILASGTLNDVATCYYILGNALEATNQKDLAKQAYHDVQKFTYARAWDPRGYFWSPAEAATQSLLHLP